MSSDREANLERALSTWVRATGGKAYKITGNSQMGAPDRLFIFPGPVFLMAELKKKGEKLRPRQVAEHKELRALGVNVQVFDSRDQVIGFFSAFFSQHNIDFSPNLNDQVRP